MVARIPLIVNSSVNQIQELPAGDTLDVEGLNSLTMTADGAIPANTPVVLTSAGKAKTISSVSASVGSPSTFYTGDGHTESATWDTSQNAFVVTYFESSVTPKIRAGTVSGTSVTYGTEVELNNDVATRHATASSNKNGGGIVTYDDNNDLYLRTFGLSGSAVTMGNQVTIKSGSGSDRSQGSHSCYLGEDGGSHYFACAYDWTGTGAGNFSRIIKYDGQNNTTLGTETSFESGHDNAKPIRCVAISSTQFVIFWSQNENKIFGVVGTRNGTQVTYGSKHTLVASGAIGHTGINATSFDACYDPLNDKLIVIYEDEDNQIGKAIICTVSDSPNTTTSNVLTSTTPIQFHNTQMSYASVRVTSMGRVLISFQDQTDSSSSAWYGVHNYGTYNLDKTTLTFAGKVSWRGAKSDSIAMTNMDDGKILTAYTETDSVHRTIVRQEESTDLNGDNFLGFTVGAYSDGDTARISVSGSTTTQSGLRTGKKYYVQNNGTLGTGTATFGVLAGKAISETLLLITASSGSATFLPGTAANGYNTQLQYNDDGDLAGANLRYNDQFLEGCLDFVNNGGVPGVRMGCFHRSYAGGDGSLIIYTGGNVDANGNPDPFSIQSMHLQVKPTGTIITGSLSKTSGSFRIPHPLVGLSTTKDLVHSFIEGPQCDNIYRGKIDLVGGTATVNLDTKSDMTAGTFVALNRDIQCFTTNETGWTNVKGSVSGNILTITAQDNSCTDTISWMVVGERQDDGIKSSDLTNANGKLIMEPNQSIPPTI